MHGDDGGLDMAAACDGLLAVAERLSRGLPRAVSVSQVQGLLAATRAHPSLEAALDYAARKRALAERQGQRVELQFWEQVGSGLRAAVAEGTAEPTAGQLAQAFAQHLVAENWLRQAEADEARSATRGGMGG